MASDVASSAPPAPIPGLAARVGRKVSDFPIPGGANRLRCVGVSPKLFRQVDALIRTALHGCPLVSERHRE